MMVTCDTHLKSASWKAVTVLKRPKMVLTVLVSRSGKYRMVSELKLTFAWSNDESHTIRRIEHAIGPVHA